jgi:predicted adenylyl cyclase CyaB
MTTPAHNLERKCRHDHLPAVRAVLAEMAGAVRVGTLAQVDVYFHARHGRLKLRLIDGGQAELIGYERPDDSGIRASSYHRTAVADPAGARAVLAGALGVRGEVWKVRELWLWHNVRIHLDDVRDLGTFIELEAVLDEANDEALSLVRLDELGRRLGLDPARDVGGSYADLLEL